MRTLITIIVISINAKSLIHIPPFLLQTAVLYVKGGKKEYLKLNLLEKSFSRRNTPPEPFIDI